MQLVKIHQGEKINKVTGRKTFIRFDPAKNRAGGYGSCNSFGSAMTLKDNTLSFSNIFSTKMYCEGVQSIEDSFLSLLQKVTRYEMKGNSLLLFESEKVVLEFEK